MRKSNQILFGIILLLIGILAYVASFFEFNYLAIALAVSGFAFLLLYKTKRKSWSLVAGVYSVYASIAVFLPDGIASGALFTAMFFIAPGIIFLVLYFSKNKKSLLLPACILIWFGLFFILRITPLNGIINMFFLCIGGAMFTAYILGKGGIGRWAVYLGLAFCAIGLISLINIPLAMSPTIVPAGIIVCGLIVIIAALRKKKNN